MSGGITGDEGDTNAPQPLQLAEGRSKKQKTMLNY